MFPTRFFPDSYFAPYYWPKVGGTPSETVDDFLLCELAAGPILSHTLVAVPALTCDLMTQPDIHLGEDYGIVLDLLRLFTVSTPLTTASLSAQLKDPSGTNVGSPVTLSYIGGSRYRYYGVIPASVTAGLTLYDPLDPELHTILVTGTITIDSTTYTLNRSLPRRVILAGSE